MIKVSLVIPNYNGKKLLEKNLPKVIEACKNWQKSGWEIIVVDDGSTDESVNLLQSYHAKLKVLVNKKTLGFSSTVNRGVKEAKGEIVVLLNTDVYPEKGFLETILPHFQDSRVFAVGMMDKSMENNKVVLRGRGIGWWQKGFYVHKRGEINKKDTDWVSGGSGVFRRSVFLKFGGFDEIYNPFYWEDIDLSYRAVKAGYKILFEPKAKVIHEHQKGAIKKNFSEKQIKIISYRNQFLFVWRNANFQQWLSHLFWLPYHLVLSIIKSRDLFLIGFFSAIIRFLVFKIQR